MIKLEQMTIAFLDTTLRRSMSENQLSAFALKALTGTKIPFVSQ